MNRVENQDETANDNCSTTTTSQTLDVSQSSTITPVIKSITIKNEPTPGNTNLSVNVLIFFMNDFAESVFKF